MINLINGTAICPKTEQFRNDIDFEYNDDGIGTGPTMEFFTLSTNNLQRQDLQL